MVLNGELICCTGEIWRDLHAYHFLEGTVPVSSLPARGPCGKGVHLESGRPVFGSCFHCGSFSRWNHASDLQLVHQWLPCQAPGIIKQCWDWSVQCQYTVTG